MSTSANFSHRARAEQNGDGVEVLSEEYLAKCCPQLAGFLSEEVGDGASSKKNTLTLFYDAGTWKFSLSDKEANLKTFSSLDTLEGFLESVEAHYTDPTVKWRKDSPWRRRSSA